jgi:multiple sugar transport system permease protein
VSRVPPAAWFLAPALAAITLFFLLPVLASLGLSLTDFDVYAIGDPSTLRFVGASNYRALAADPVFWTALRNTFYFVVLAGPLSVAVSLAAAVLVDARWVRGRSLWRTAFFLPVVATLVAVAVVWRALYHPRQGLFARGLEAAGLPPVDFLGDPTWAMPALVAMAVWKNFGFHMVIFVAGLQSIPDRLYEAARLDGAGAWARFRHVTLPMLAPTLLFVSISTGIGCFQLFAEPYVMTAGGPSNATLSLVLLMYREGFRWWNLGYAAAIAFVLFVLILAASALQLRLRGAGPWRPA